jgi:Zn-dependent protease with chaperone function
MPVTSLVSPRRRLLQGSAFAVSLALLSGCANAPKSMAEIPFIGKSSGPVASPVGELAAPVARTWPDASQDVLNQRARGFGLVNAPDMQRYLNALYARIKTKAGVPAWPGSVHILANEALNAYATGAGNIYVSLPWLTSAESEDELVALLSHEFGHIYLHYHQLEGAVEDANTAVGVMGIGMALIKKTGQVAGWTQLDSLSTAYAVGRGLVTTVYSRSQESAADNFGLNLSMKLGYSYEHGTKAFLERIATWEERNQKLDKEKEEQLLKAIKQQSMNDAMKTAAKQPNNAVSVSFAQSTGEISGGINSAMQQIGFEVNKAAAKLRSDHPETTERIDALASAVEPFPEIQANTEPVIKPLKNALQEKRTAAILKNYALAFKAINAPKDPASLIAAKNATAAPTATHAVPLFALYSVLNEQPEANGRKRADPSQVLEANFSSEPDRAWKAYLERGSKLKDGRQTAAAKKVMESGLAYFQTAEEAWPDAIRFQGETKGWPEAKTMAANCGKTFRRMSQRCTQAAASPAELADVEKKNKAKTEQLADKMFKKK